MTLDFEKRAVISYSQLRSGIVQVQGSYTALNLPSQQERLKREETRNPQASRATFSQRTTQILYKLSSMKNSLTARSRGTNSRCPIPRSSSTRHAYSFTSLLLSSCMSWDFLTGGVILAAGAGQGTPSSMSSKQVSRMRRLDLSSTILRTAERGEPGYVSPGGCTRWSMMGTVS